LKKIDEQWPVFIKNGTNKTNNAIDQVHSPDTDSLLWDSSIVGKIHLDNHAYLSEYDAEAKKIQIS